MQKIQSTILFVFIFCSLLSAQERYSRVKIDLSKTDLKTIAKLGLETDHGFVMPGVHFVNEFSKSELEILDRHNIEYFILVDDVVARYKSRQAGNIEKRGAPPCESQIKEYNYTTPENYEDGSMGGYFTYSEMLTILDSMQTKYPQLISIRDSLEDITTWDGNKIYWLRVSDNPNLDEEEPEVLYTALHHAREPNGLSQMIFYLWYLLENYETDEEVKYLVDNTEMYFMPCLNPDGYIYNESIEPTGGGLWRKNRRPNDDADAIGVDLNRNYGYEWGYDDGGSSPDSTRATYRGPAPFSEPETQAVRDFTIDRNIEVALNYHTFGNLLIHPWGFNDTPTDEDDVFKSMGRAMIDENEYVMGTGTETVGYVVNGDSDDYLYGEEGEKDKIYAFTPEVGRGFWPDQEEISDFNKSCMKMNMATAHIPHNFYTVKVKNLPSLVTAFEGSFELIIDKPGLRDGDVKIDITSDNPYVSFDQFSFTTSLELGASDTMTINYVLDSAISEQENVEFKISYDNGEFIFEKDYQFLFENLESDIVFEDELVDLSQWNNEGVWGITKSDFVSSPTCLTDSPNGNYTPNVINTISLVEGLDLGNNDRAELTFSAKWLIEANYDYCVVQASTDNQNWTSLCGEYTRNGLNTHGTSDPLYDGIQDEWVRERMDLSDYLGEELYLRLRLVSDGAVETDGFYIDDVKVELQSLIPTSLVDQQRKNVSIYPSLNNGSFTVKKVNSKLIYLPISIIVIISIVVITFEVPHYSLMHGFLMLAGISIFMASIVAALLYRNSRNKYDGESLYILTASSLLFGFVIFFALFSFVNRKYATFHCESSSYTVVDYKARYSSGYGKLDKDKIVANQWILTVLKGNKEARYSLRKNVFRDNIVTSEVDLEFCKGMLGTSYLNVGTD